MYKKSSSYYASRACVVKTYIACGHSRHGYDFEKALNWGTCPSNSFSDFCVWNFW